MDLTNHPGYYKHSGLGADNLHSNFGPRALAIALGRSILHMTNSEKIQVIVYMKDMGFSPRAILIELNHRGFTLQNHRQTETIWRQIYDRWYEVGQAHLLERSQSPTPPSMPTLFDPHVDLLHRIPITLASNQDLRAELRSFNKPAKGKAAALRKKVETLRMDFFGPEDGNQADTDVDMDAEMEEAEGGVGNTDEGMQGGGHHHYEVHSN